MPHLKNQENHTETGINMQHTNFGLLVMFIFWQAT